MKKLKRELKQTKKKAYAEGTIANVLVQWKAFNKFCDKYGIHDWPASTETLCLFAQHLAKRMRSVKTIENYLYAVKKLHLYAGTKQVPNLKDFQIQLTLRGIKRQLRHRVRQAKPLTPKLLLKISQQLDPKNSTHLVFWAALLTGFYLLLRKSNLVPKNQNSFDKKKQLSRKNVHVTKKYVKVVITWSKTIQFNQKKLSLKMYKIPKSRLCPVLAFNNMFAAVRIQQNDPCFLCKNGKPLSYHMLKYYLKKFLKQAKVKKYFLYSGHSMRRGGLDWGYRLGLSKSYLKALGNWKSNCFEAYLSFPKKTRNFAAKAVRDSLKELF